MASLDEADITRLVREAFEEEDPVEEGLEQCCSYASLSLLLSDAGSTFVSPKHVAECQTCRRMLARIVRRRCPSLGVLHEYQQRKSGFASISELGDHISRCWRCRLRLLLARGLAADSSGTKAQVGSRIPLVAIASAICLVLIAAIWLNLGHRQSNLAKAPPSQSAPDQHAPTRPIPQKLQPQSTEQASNEKEKGISAPSRTIPFIASFTMQVSSERGEGDPNQIRIPREAVQVRLLVPLSHNHYPTYRASFKNADGAELLVREGKFSPSRKALIINLPATALPAGDCILTIKGVDSTGATSEAIEEIALRVARP